jgi:hypothetical protein
LDEQVLRQLLTQANPQLTATVCYGKRGREYVRQNLPRFNLAARHQPFIVLADLEQDECAPTLIQTWLPTGLHSQLVLRVAVRTIESWLLADQKAFADFLGVSIHHASFPRDPEALDHPKQVVVNLARRSRFRQLREDLVPAPNSTSHVGKNYVGRLTQFVLNEWQAERARAHAPSLERAFRALQKFTPSKVG